jgi:hypothetical protein
MNDSGSESEKATVPRRRNRRSKSPKQREEQSQSAKAGAGGKPQQQRYWVQYLDAMDDDNRPVRTAIVKAATRQDAKRQAQISIHKTAGSSFANMPLDEFLHFLQGDDDDDSHGSSAMESIIATLASIEVVPLREWLRKQKHVPGEEFSVMY